MKLIDLKKIDKTELKFAEKINKIIIDYNNINKDDEKLDQLQKNLLLEVYEQLLFRNNFVKQADDLEHYAPVRDELYISLNQEIQKLGMTSVLELKLKYHTQTTFKLPEILVNMSPEKRNKFTKYLYKGNGKNSFNFDEIYSPEEKKNLKEAQDFNDFFKNNKINFIGGVNSLNFKVENSQDASCCILKIEKRMGTSKDVEFFLRDKIPEYFPPIFAECEPQLVDSHILKLVVTEYFPQGDISQLTQNLHEKQKIVKITNNIFIKLGTLLNDLKKQKTLHPDAKGTNFLVTKENNLIMTDTKTLIRDDIETEGFVCEINPLFTKGFVPFNEMLSIKINIDHVHAYTLGVNLLLFLSKSTFRRIDESKLRDLEIEIKSSPEYTLYTELISNLLNNDPKKRMSVQDAITQLHAIEALQNLNIWGHETSYKNEFLTIATQLAHENLLINAQSKEDALLKTLLELETLKINSPDKIMDDFIQVQINTIKSSPKKREQVIEQLKLITEQLKQDKVAPQLKTIIQDLSTIHKELAQAVDEEWKKIPIKDRVNLTSYFASQKGNDLLNLLDTPAQINAFSVVKNLSNYFCNLPLSLFGHTEHFNKFIEVLKANEDMPLEKENNSTTELKIKLFDLKQENNPPQQKLSGEKK